MSDKSTIHFCQTSDLHPYECNGIGNCIHCDKRANEKHNPSKCWLCCDGDPDLLSTSQE